MRFLLLMSDDGLWDRCDDEERDAIVGAHVEFAAVAAGRILAGEALASADEAVRLAPRSRTLTEGPFADAAEQLGGFYLLETTTREEALELCGALPPAYTLELWPVVDADLDVG